jgi:hypothetical protein
MIFFSSKILQFFITKILDQDPDPELETNRSTTLEYGSKEVFDNFLTIKVSKVYYVKNVGSDQYKKVSNPDPELDANCSSVQMKGRVSSKQIACM